MGNDSSGPPWAAGSGDAETTQVIPDHTPTTRAGPDHTETVRTGPGYTEAARTVPDYGALTTPSSTVPADPVPRPPAADADAITDRVPPPGSREAREPREPQILRYGPGVPATPPASQVPLTAERLWRTGGPRHGTRPPRRARKPIRLLSTALTVALLAASGVLFYLRFQHAPFHVSTVKILGQAPNGCGVNVTGQIITNGSAGTVSYQWVFRPDPHPPQRLSQSVTAGQHAVIVTVAVEGEGRGRAAPTVTLQVLGPDPRADSTVVVVSC